MPSKEAIEINEMFKNIPKGNDPLGYLKEREEGRKRPKPQLPANMTLKELELGGNYAELIEKPGNDGPLIMYIHGGGFQTGAAQERREITFEIANKHGSNVISINYRLAPENKWPAPLEDCVAAYKEILNMGYKSENIVIAGESAGGTLVLGTVLYLKDHGIELPKAAVAYSAGTNNNTHFKSHTANARTDYMLGDSIASSAKKESLFNNIEEAEEKTKSPYISPYFGDYAGMCPIFLAASDIEALYDDSLEVYQRILDAGVKTELYIGHGLIHAYPIFTHLPEARDTLAKTFEFLSEI